MMAGPFTSSEIAELRAQTPATGHRIHLNHASTSLMPRAVTGVMTDFIALEQAVGTHAAMEAHARDIEGVRHAVAALLNCPPRNIAFVETASRGWALALGACVSSGLRRIALARSDWGANILNASAMATGSALEVSLVPIGPLGQSSPAALVQAGAGGAVAFSLVPTSSGVAADVETIAEEARRREALVMIDAAQAVGQIPVDVSALGADVLVFPARKWLRGPKGAAVLFVSDRILAQAGPPLRDLGGGTWTGADDFLWRDDARRFESFEFNPAVRLGLGAAARLAREVGPGRIAARIRALVNLACTRLAALGAPLPMEAGDPAATGIMTWADRRRDVGALVEALRQRGIFAAAIGESQARLALEARGGPVLRASVHYFNTEDEIEAFAAGFAALWHI